MASLITLTALPRSADAKPKALRRAHYVPGVLYGPQYATRPLQFESAVLQRVLQQAGTSHLIELNIDGQDGSELVLVREIQRHPVTRALLHVDLFRTQADVAIRLEVPIVHRGTAPAIAHGGYVNTLLDALEVECLPRDVPESIVADLSTLVDMDSEITVADLRVPEGVTVLTPVDTVVVRPAISAQKEEVEAPAAEAPAEGEQGAAAPTEAAEV